MAKTLRGAPIVGYYKSEKQDFADHGSRMIFDDEGIKFECMTRPYGFVAPNAEVWFQKFEDYDDFGNSIVREYLMTTGFLWTGQFEECRVAVDEGRPQSMELDEDTLNGEWTKNYNTGMDFFIINDAIFSKLCILGDDVEPCFEGSSVKAPEVSKTFSLDNDFRQTLYTMIQDLKTVLEGGEQMLQEEKNFSNEQDNSEKEMSNENQMFIENENSTDATVVEPAVEEQPSEETSFAKKDEEEKEEEKGEAAPEANDDADDDSEEKSKEDKDEEDEEKKKYALLENQFAELQSQYSALQEEYNELVSFKNQIENEKKDELINSFYMLSDEDKAEVVANKTQYSLDDIEAKLSVICVRKKVNFSVDEEVSQVNTPVETPAVTFNLESQASSVPAWVSALKNTKNSRNI